MTPSLLDIFYKNAGLSYNKENDDTLVKDVCIQIIGSEYSVTIRKRKL
jgi:hypothetical protein